MMKLRNRWGWATLALLLGLISWLLAHSSYAHLAVIQAKKLTVRGKPAVQLLIQTDQGAGKEIIVQVGTNKITFQTDSRGHVNTGYMEIPSDATAVSVHMPTPGDELWPAQCTIPLDQIPKDKFERVAACLDLEPPVTRFSQSPGKNAYGWNRSPVTVTLQATDAKSGVKHICYELAGAITQGQRCAAGAQLTFTIGASPNGITTVRFFAEDRWVDQGQPKPNRESAKEEVVRIDTGAPSISGSRSPEPNSHGWNKGSVQVSFACSDGLSGIASCSGDRTLSSEGANQVVTGRAEDRAGNTNATTVSVNIDMTKPTVRPAGAATCSQPGASGWCRGEITVPFEASDNLSGFPPDGRRTLQFTRSTSQEGASVLVTGAVEDLAGNRNEATVGPFKLDRTPPTVILRGLPSPFPQGGSASISWEITDGLSGVDPSTCLVTISLPWTTSPQTLSTACSGQQSLSPERLGEGIATVRVRAQDYAGNEGSQSVGIELRRFRQAPTADFTCSPTQGRPPLTVHCSDRSSGEITSWLWDWGDGTTSSERNPSHTYTRSGRYQITLTVRGPGGESRKPFCCIEVLQTGDVKVTLIWNSKADLDLHVIDPNGCEVFWYNPTCPSGGKLDVDANAGCEENVTTSPVENIFWPSGQAPRGEYRVYVDYFMQCSGASSTESFTVRVLVDGTEQVFSGTISFGDSPKLITTFRR